MHRAEATAEEDRGVRALTEGRIDEGVAALRVAAAAWLAAGDEAAALDVLGNLALVLCQRGQLGQALELAERALRLPVPPARSALALINVATVLDAAVDARARGVWMLAAHGLVKTRPVLQVVCLAHAIGAELAQGAGTAMVAGRVLLSRLGPETPTSLLASLVGAMGESAGPRGQPLRLQAVWLLATDPAGFHASHQPHWQAVVESSGLDSALAVDLCALGLAATLARQGAEDAAVLTAGVKLVFDQVAAARALDAAALAALVQSRSDALGALADQLRALVPGDAWVLPR